MGGRKGVREEGRRVVGRWQPSPGPGGRCLQRPQSVAANRSLSHLIAASIDGAWRPGPEPPPAGNGPADCRLGPAGGAAGGGLRRGEWREAMKGGEEKNEVGRKGGG